MSDEDAAVTDDFERTGSLGPEWTMEYSGSGQLGVDGDFVPWPKSKGSKIPTVVSLSLDKGPPYNPYPPRIYFAGHVQSVRKALAGRGCCNHIRGADPPP